MPYAPLPVRMTTVVAHQSMRIAMWDGCEAGRGRLHIVRQPVGEPVPADQPEPGFPELARGWDGACRDCGQPIPWDGDVNLSACIDRLWDTASGQPEPGCLYWDKDWAGRCFNWDNCDGRHLHAVLPNGIPWDIDSRAANCNRRADRLHRCWVRTGEPPNVTAGKGGVTCSAGAGSIAAGDYHGFLIDGAFTAG